MRAAILPKATKEVRVQAPTADLDRWANDFPGFAAQLTIVDKEGHETRLRPNAIQRDFEAARSGRDIVLKPRQVGLTAWECARDIWYFLTRRNARVVVVCQSITGDLAIKEVSGKIRDMLASLKGAGVIVPGISSRSTTEWVLPERNAVLRVVGAGASEASAAKKGRGGTIHRLHVTELAFFEYASATMNALTECVPSGPHTEIVFESTANGAAGYFYEEYQDAKAKRSSFKAHFFRWLDQAEYRIPLEPGETITPETDREREVVKAGGTPEQLKWYRKKVADKKSQDLVDQEYPLDEETCWLTAGRLFFDKERTKQLLAETREPIEQRSIGREGTGELRIYARPRTGQRYLIALDPSEGIGGDPGAGVVYDRETGEHVATLHGQFPTWEMARLAAEVGQLYAGQKPNGELEPALLVVERNNHGHAVLQALAREVRYTNVYDGPDERPGWPNTPTSRPAALEALHDAHREVRWSSPDRASLEEMLRFVVLANGRPEAAPGAHDDLVLAHAIAWDVLTKPVVRRFRTEVYDYSDTDDDA